MSSGNGPSRSSASTAPLADFKTWDVVREIPIYSEHELADDYYREVRQLLRTSPHQSEWEQVLSKGEPRRGHTEESYATRSVQTSSRREHHGLSSQIAASRADV